MARSRKKMDNNDKLLALWSLSKANDAIEAYKKAVRKYCLTSRNSDWDAVLKARCDAYHCGVSDEVMIELDKEVINSISEADLLEVVGV